ncbi:MAG: SIS domain-containing protein [Flavobacteriales bacterium]|nr:SIS domain-containing protein [Flavobacteriales bacterium]
MKTFLAIGELIYDHYFHESNGGVFYEDSSGGGTAWNVISKLSKSNNECYSLGVYGGLDPYGEIAKKELEHFGVNCSHLVKQPGRNTYIISQVLNLKNRDHKFGDTCQICGQKPNYSKLAKIKNNEFDIDWNKIDIIIVDKLVQDRINLIKKAKIENPDIQVVLDIGRSGFLRYIPVSKIYDQLKLFDIIFFNQSAFEPIKKRLEKYFNEKSFQLLLFSHLSNCNFFFVTKGENGIDLFERNGNYSFLEAKNTNIIDSSGAGDFFMAGFLDKWAKSDKNGNIKQIAIAALSNINIVLSSYGARGYLKSTKLSLDIDQYIQKNIKNIDSTLTSGKCAFCYNEISNRSKKVIRKKKATIKSIISDLPKRTLFTLENHTVIDRCKSVLNNLKGFGIVIGTGGSYSAATYISFVINQKTSAFAEAMRPHNYLKLINKKVDFIIIVSYSGNTLDYFPIIQNSTRSKVEKIILVTHAKNSRLEYLTKNQRILTNDDVIVYSSQLNKKERGFLSIAGTIMPSVLFYSATSDSQNNISFQSLINTIINKRYQNLQSISDSIGTTGIIEVFGGGFSWPAVIDFESKIIESGLSSVQMHELKDFSHGRFMFTLNRKNPKIILLTDKTEYDKRLIEIFSKDLNVLILESVNSGLQGGLELLIEVQYLVYKLSKLINPNSDISKPSKVPSKGLELYRWHKPEFF